MSLVMSNKLQIQVITLHVSCLKKKTQLAAEAFFFPDIFFLLSSIHAIFFSSDNAWIVQLCIVYCLGTMYPWLFNVWVLFKKLKQLWLHGATIAK